MRCNHDLNGRDGTAGEGSGAPHHDVTISVGRRMTSGTKKLSRWVQIDGSPLTETKVF